MIGQFNHHPETRIIARSVVVLAALGFEFGVEPRALGLTPSLPEPSESRQTLLVSVVADERLFTLFAALNVAGYDREINPDGMSETRLAVRAFLANRPLPILPVLRLYGGMCQQVRISRCAMYVLHLGPAPEFARVVRGWFVDAPEHHFLGFDWALREFHREADITSLWRQYRPAYEHAVAAYSAVAAPLAETALHYIRIASLQARTVVVIPNLLDTGWVGYGPQIDDTAYVILGPSSEVETGLVQHELPIFGPPSELAARASVAAARQGKQQELRRRFMRTPMVAEEPSVRRVAETLDLDVEQLLIDMSSAGVQAELDRTRALADLFGFIGTPGLVIGRTVLTGAVPLSLLREIAQEEKAEPVPVC